MTAHADTQANVQHAIPSDRFKTNNEQMKTLKLCKLSILVVVIALLSCSKDDEDYYTKPKHLVGTEWKHIPDYNSDIRVDYELLKFMSTTVVECYVKYENSVTPIKECTATYVIHQSEITLDSGDGTATGTIRGKEMIFTVDDPTIIYTKQ